jgi:hypothetical protein
MSFNGILRKLHSFNATEPIFPLNKITLSFLEDGTGMSWGSPSSGRMVIVG